MVKNQEFYSALKSILAKSKFTNLVFDEIDSGTSGEIANSIGGMMKIMEENSNISITHLAQVASKADHHYKVFKSY